MALCKCDECQKIISSKSEWCPFCGARYLSQRGIMMDVFLGVFLAMAAFSIILMFLKNAL